MSTSSTSPPRVADEFEARLHEHRGIVFKVANTYAPGAADRDDLIQEILLQLWRSYPRYDSGRRFSTWMYRVAFNTAISFARARRVRENRVGPLDDFPAPTGIEATQADERLDQLYRVLHGLDVLDRALMVLHLEERSYREIGEILGISETNVGTKLNRLKQKIRRDLTTEEEARDGAR